MRGRDIKRYGYEWANLYLIATHNGIPEKNVPRVNIDNYPAVKKHLDQYWDKISTRADMGDTPYNLRSCAYMDDFSKQKIVWGNLGLMAGFSEAPAGMFVNAPCPMIVPFDSFLLMVLNSRLGDWYIRQLGVTRNGGYFEYKPMFVEQLPVPHMTTEEINKILSFAKNTHDENTINNVIYDLYKLADDERKYLNNC